MFNHASFIWSAADLLRGTYKQHEYGDIILPFTVLARLDAVLAPTKEAVLAAIAKSPGDSVPSAPMLRARAGHNYDFFNVSQHNLKTLQGDPDNLEQNLRDYVLAFSPNVREIFDKYKFEETVALLSANDLLLQILQHFAKANLHPDNVSNEQMGHIFEELIRKFAEASNETAGEHFTPREVVDLMVTLLLTDETDLMTPGITRSVYDPTAGTGGMLSTAADKIVSHNPDAAVELLGQEINAASYAICKADMVVKGQPIENIVHGNTLTNPAFEDRQFHYGLSNPPFGVDWKKEKASVDREHQVMGHAGRFGPGLPRVSDGSLLFLMHLISKLQEPKGDQKAGRGAIVLNGSPLFTGGAGSGESNIRKWVLDNDYLEAIIGLPTDMFYNTGISTYIWVLNKQKEPARKRKVQLIDATQMFRKMRKSVGSKRKELGTDDIKRIAEIFSNFESADSEHSKIFNVEDFFYRTITVERPLKLNYAFSPERVERALALKAVTKLNDDDRSRLRVALSAAQIDDGLVSTNRQQFQADLMKAFNQQNLALKPALVRALVSELGEHDDDGELVAKAGKPEANTALRDTENVPWDQDIHDYLEREVKPFVPDAWIDESKTKEGAEIPFTRHFYKYVPPRPLEEIDRDLDEVLGRIRARLEQVKA
ncbi:SAM-dependent DNA methyltransferase [Kocuria soli]|uniref:site-specific DNA-methyltransferase (adenine-specific) n=1 Tax=Kocuria soli TaxID=2485125 RepID=A0A3N3ZS51_9MICC|nr:class I SAM-dependent DNA methyltransferase [Kocuria soli]ROZ64286.1 SAM-dependent DNA methyltransferase [Kocuria soli]